MSRLFPSALANTPSRSASFALPERALRLIHETRWLGLAVVAAFLVIVLLGYQPTDPGWSRAGPDGAVMNPGGRVGAWIADLLLYLFGLSSYLVPAAVGVAVVRGMRAVRQRSAAAAAAAAAAAQATKTLEEAHA